MDSPTASAAATVIRRATRADLPEIVRLHAISLPQFFLADSGLAFLRYFYSIVIFDPRGILLVCEQNGELAGFIAGFTDPASLRSELSFGSFRLLAAAAACLIVHPFQFPKLLLDVCRVGQLQDQLDTNPHTACELITIAIQPRFRREGRGKILTRALMHASGSHPMQVKVKVGSDDTWMKSFYLKLGFEPLRTLTMPDSSCFDELVFPARKR